MKKLPHTGILLLALILAAAVMTAGCGTMHGWPWHNGGAWGGGAGCSSSTVTVSNSPRPGAVLRPTGLITGR